MKQKLIKEIQPALVKEIKSTGVNILPWIKDGSYKSEESIKKREALIKELYGDAKPGTILWDMHHRTVI